MEIDRQIREFVGKFGAGEFRSSPIVNILVVM